MSLAPFMASLESNIGYMAMLSIPSDFWRQKMCAVLGIDCHFQPELAELEREVHKLKGQLLATICLQRGQEACLGGRPLRAAEVRRLSLRDQEFVARAMAKVWAEAKLHKWRGWERKGQEGALVDLYAWIKAAQQLGGWRAPGC